ncbi:MAG TPA: TIGR03936 family radical SAM-associated protein [Aggregatilinea sp.]|uniref:TIGR03936 family radical SAM-associated protein n=1 Tax=Aggregatilinea sp. TaxID=2806333 RepID=UPI002BC3A3BE|nr:TIGR03936 family radical SAM-associated protein [Aggregatilinea sp.]HML23079.1 TIGR03936 family radical SAM-associated protein [Aggregatilinea sp.]
MNQPLTQQRIRVAFTKEGPYRFIGHLDLAKAWERVLRRAQIPLEYTQGFNPRPRMQFAAALPVGVTSEDERVDIWLTEHLHEGFEETWIERLNDASPAGLRTRRIEDVAIKDDALPTLVTSADYVITPRDPALTPDVLRERAAALLTAEKLERVRGSKNEKVYDLRPLILDLRLIEDGALLARLVTGERGTGRADELLDALGIALDQTLVHRRRLYLGDEPA